MDNVKTIKIKCYKCSAVFKYTMDEIQNVSCPKCGETAKNNINYYKKLAAKKKADELKKNIEYNLHIEQDSQKETEKIDKSYIISTGNVISFLIGCLCTAVIFLTIGYISNIHNDKDLFSIAEDNITENDVNKDEMYSVDDLSDQFEKNEVADFDQEERGIETITQDTIDYSIDNRKGSRKNPIKLGDDVDIIFYEENASDRFYINTMNWKVERYNDKTVMMKAKLINSMNSNPVTFYSNDGYRLLSNETIIFQSTSDPLKFDDSGDLLFPSQKVSVSENETETIEFALSESDKYFVIVSLVYSKKPQADADSILPSSTFSEQNIFCYVYYTFFELTESSGIPEEMETKEEVLVSVIDKRNKQADYDHGHYLPYVEFDLEAKNNYKNKSIKGIEGTIVCSDMFGKEFARISADLTGYKIPPGELYIYDGLFIDVALGVNDMQTKLYGLDYDDMVCKYEIKSIVFDE